MNTPNSAAEAEAQAERIRHELSGTIDQLKDNLHPARLAGEALETTRAHTPDWVASYISFIASPAGLALLGATTASIVSTVAARNKRRRFGGQR